jgi:hypothetical protein
LPHVIQGRMTPFLHYWELLLFGGNTKFEREREHSPRACRGEEAAPKKAA